MLGTPITSTWPEWPPDANVKYSSRRPDGVYVASAAWTSASLRLRAFMSADSPSDGELVASEHPQAAATASQTIAFMA